MLLRLDSGSNAPLLYAAHSRRATGPSMFDRVVNGIEQAFTVLAAGGGSSRDTLGEDLRSLVAQQE